MQLVTINKAELLITATSDTAQPVLSVLSNTFPNTFSLAENFGFVYGKINSKVFEDAYNNSSKYRISISGKPYIVGGVANKFANGTWKADDETHFNLRVLHFYLHFGELVLHCYGLKNYNGQYYCNFTDKNTNYDGTRIYIEQLGDVSEL